MKTITLMTVALTTALTTASAHADQAKKNAEFCDALSDLHGSMRTIDNIGPSSTLGELRSAVERFDGDAKRVQKAAGKLKGESATKFTTAAKKLRGDTNDLPDNITIDQAKQRLQDDIRRVKEAEKKLATEAGCPEEAAPMEPKSGEPKSGDQKPSDQP